MELCPTFTQKSVSQEDKKNYCDLKMVGVSEPLTSGMDIWYEVFMWALISSLFIYSIAAAGAFFTLRKHKFGR